MPNLLKVSKHQGGHHERSWLKRISGIICFLMTSIQFVIIIGYVATQSNEFCQLMIAQMAESLVSTWRIRVQIPAPAPYEITL